MRGLVALVCLTVLGGCSYLSTIYVLEDATGHRASDTDRRWEACERARTNMINARDPIEARRWELIREDLNCPTQAPERL